MTLHVPLDVPAEYQIMHVLHARSFKTGMQFERQDLVDYLRQDGFDVGREGRAVSETLGNLIKARLIRRVCGTRGRQTYTLVADWDEPENMAIFTAIISRPKAEFGAVDEERLDRLIWQAEMETTHRCNDDIMSFLLHCMRLVPAYVGCQALCWLPCLRIHFGLEWETGPAKKRRLAKTLRAVKERDYDFLEKQIPSLVLQP